MFQPKGLVEESDYRHSFCLPPNHAVIRLAFFPENRAFTFEHCEQPLFKISLATDCTFHATCPGRSKSAAVARGNVGEFAGLRTTVHGCQHF